MTRYEEIAKRICDADAVLIGASNGLSISEGLHIFAEDQAFGDIFGDFKERYGLYNILSGLLARWPSQEAKWAFLSRLIGHYSIGYTGSPMMDQIRDIIGGRPYFVVTSNGECHFELAGYDPDSIYEIEGSWGEMQCARGCHDLRYPVFPLIPKMAAAEKDCKVPSALVPRCPKCGGEMRLGTSDEKAQQRCQDFIGKYHGKRLLILELGIGWRNQLIKAPLMNLVQREPHAVYITVNKGEIYIPDVIREKSYGLDGDVTDVLKLLSDTVKEERCVCG